MATQFSFILHQTCHLLSLFNELQLSNHLFEELAMDVYDEVDRRETDAGEYKTDGLCC